MPKSTMLNSRSSLELFSLFNYSIMSFLPKFTGSTKDPEIIELRQWDEKLQADQDLAAVFEEFRSFLSDVLSGVATCEPSKSSWDILVEDCQEHPLLSPLTKYSIFDAIKTAREKAFGEDDESDRAVYAFELAIIIEKSYGESAKKIREGISLWIKSVLYNIAGYSEPKNQAMALAQLLAFMKNIDVSSYNPIGEDHQASLDIREVKRIVDEAEKSLKEEIGEIISEQSKKIAKNILKDFISD